MVEAVSDGTGANWQLANLFPRKVLQGDFEPGFRITHMAKDLRIAAEVAGELGLDLPELALARARLEEARARFGDDRRLRRGGPADRLVGAAMTPVGWSSAPCVGFRPVCAAGAASQPRRSSVHRMLPGVTPVRRARRETS